jgi:hypothetical protein
VPAQRFVQQVLRVQACAAVAGKLHAVQPAQIGQALFAHDDLHIGSVWSWCDTMGTVHEMRPSLATEGVMKMDK